MASTIKSDENEGGIISTAIKISDLIDTKAVIDYIFERQNEDGGYTFCQQTDSSAQDTFYAIEILGVLDTNPRNVKKTITFLQGLQHQDGGFDSVKVAYYVLNALNRLGSASAKPTHWLEQSSTVLINGFAISDTYIEVVSEIEDIHIVVELLNALNLTINPRLIIEQISRLQNNDGSFGSSKHSKIASAYHALATLKILKYNDVETIRRTLEWIRQCEAPSGGFVGEPDFLNTIFLEEIYFGTKALSILEEKPLHPQETLGLIAKFQNSNGGFRRSVFLGLSEFESTYQALSSIETILRPYIFRKSLNN